MCVCVCVCVCVEEAEEASFAVAQTATLSTQKLVLKTSFSFSTLIFWGFSNNFGCGLLPQTPMAEEGDSRCP